jgi:RNA polymerase sigma-70 factor, ECF subfamily
MIVRSDRQGSRVCQRPAVRDHSDQPVQRARRPAPKRLRRRVKQNASLSALYECEKGQIDLAFLHRETSSKTCVEMNDIAKLRGKMAMLTHEKRYKERSETADSMLVQQALSGDQEAFEGLVSRYQQPLFGLIYHYVGEYHETEDILQQVWLQLYLSLATLRPSAQIKPWLVAVARNRSLDFLRRKHVLSQRLLFFCEAEVRIEEDEVSFLEAIPDTSPTPEELVEHLEHQREIQHAIRALPYTYRPVVWLFYAGQLTYAEIGRILDISGSSVKTRFNRAKPLLRTACATP